MKTITKDWLNILFEKNTDPQTWQNIFEEVKKISLESPNSDEIRKKLSYGDRLISESAWELWKNYSNTANLASGRLIDFIKSPASEGKAVLLIDAMSIKELPLILHAAKDRDIKPEVKILGSEIPSDTDHFAHALGLTSRSKLENNSTPKSSIFAENKFYTDVTGYPFEDCLGSIPNEKNIFIWHTWLDDLMHNVEDRKIFDKQVEEKLTSDGFWNLVNKLRQGRKLLLLSDHGYAASYYFRDEKHPQVTKKFKDLFGAKRYVKSDNSNITNDFLPPLVFNKDQNLVIVGQYKWKVTGGFPHYCHGGLTLAEVSIPVIEFEAI